MEGRVSSASSTSATCGAVSVEFLVAFLPVMLFFASVWQLADLYAAQLIVQRAASAAGRAASVVLPDDPFYYKGEPKDRYGGERRRQVERAAELVLRASGRIMNNPAVEVEGHRGIGPLTARVRADYSCFPGWGVLVCGARGRRTLTASARFAYHGASYVYP
jgi:nucleotide-binding universal stress UspA family protein